MSVSRKAFFSRVLNYFPGLVVLVFGMVALHSAVQLIDQNAQLSTLYEQHSEVYEESDLRSDFLRRHDSLLAELDKQESQLYWSVLMMGLASFILILLNGDKLGKLNQANQDKRETLRLLESRLAAMEASQDGIGIVDPDGNLSYMNDALVRLHGIPQDKIQTYIGQPWTKLYTDRGREEVDGKVLPYLRDHKVWKGTSPLLRHDGSLVVAELSLTALPDGGMIGTARDITDRIKAEEEKKQLEQQFYQAQKMEAIGRLAGGVAHDFNNVLAAINGYAEFLTEDLEKGSPQHGFATSILKAGQQARKIVDQILAFSRQKQSDKDTLDLRDPVNETVTMLNASLPKTIELTSFLAADKTHIDANATQIAQVLMNLGVNAKDAIEEDSNERGKILVTTENKSAEEIDLPHLLQDELPQPDKTPLLTIEDLAQNRARLTLGAVAKGHEYICLSFEDSGTGMSRSVMEHVMEPFFTTKDVSKGTGLGLATVHGVIASHQGALVIDSTVGKGTRFDLYFPLAQEQHHESHLSLLDTAHKLEGIVLVVEDQSDVRAMLVQMLERIGLDAQSCDNGEEAIAVLQDEPDYFDLVVTDQNMPKVTGLELIQTIHKQSPEIPFILVSGYSQEKLQDLMKEHPAIKATLRKPVSKDDLTQKIAEVMGEKKKAA